ncbi:MAG: GldG family protein [Bdellovibrionales bacterium]|nr:GldG family protein [Bdellovibrionales bacterium]
MLYQCLGISGAILFFYGLLTAALTNITDDWFVRSLWITGLFCMAVFVVKSLDRIWQKLVLIFVTANAIWILYALFHDVDTIYLALPLCALGIFFLFLNKFKYRNISVYIIFISIFGIILVLALGLKLTTDTSIVTSTTAMAGAIILNIAAFLASKNLLLEEKQEDEKFTKSIISYVYATIIFIVFAIINVLSQDFYHQWDITKNKLNTLTVQSSDLLAKLEDPLTIRLFLKEANQLRPQAKMITNLYKNASDSVVIEMIDPDVEKFQSEKFQAKDGDIVVSYHDQNYTTQTLTEEGITQAILKVTSQNSSHLCFMMGHGELDLEGPEEDIRSLSTLKKGLDNEGYTYETIQNNQILGSEHCSVLIVAGPQQTLPIQDAQAIGNFLQKGGRGIFLLDPVFTNPNLGEKNISLKLTGLEKVLFDWGVELGRNLLLQRTIEMFKGEQIVSQITGFQYGNHPIVDPLKGKQTLFDGVQSIHPRDDFEGTTYSLIESFGNGATWTKSNMKELLVDQNADPSEADILGPVPFAVATEKEGDAKTQIVVIGDADFISNELILSNEYNYDLFLNILGWLSGEQSKITIRPKLFQASAIELDEHQTKTIFYVAVILLPMIVLLFGINLWWIRRRRG